MSHVRSEITTTVIGGTLLLDRVVLLVENINMKKPIEPDSEDHRTFSIQRESATPQRVQRRCRGHDGRNRWWDDGLEDRNVVVDLGAVPLGDALGDPHNVSALLLLQLDVGVENAEVELVEEGQLVQLHLWAGR